MCQCSQFPEAVVDLTYRENRSFNFLGAELFSAYFTIPDESSFTPQLDYNITLYQCSSCGQKWYVEPTPEECPSIEFGMKYFSDNRPTKMEIDSRKQFLTILAHGGFSENLCRSSGCKNFKLKGRELCHLHITVP